MIERLWNENTKHHFIIKKLPKLLVSLNSYNLLDSPIISQKTLINITDEYTIFLIIILRLIINHECLSNHNNTIKKLERFILSRARWMITYYRCFFTGLVDFFSSEKDSSTYFKTSTLI